MSTFTCMAIAIEEAVDSKESEGFPINEKNLQIIIAKVLNDELSTDVYDVSDDIVGALVELWQECE